MGMMAFGMREPPGSQCSESYLPKVPLKWEKARKAGAECLSQLHL